MRQRLDRVAEQIAPGIDDLVDDGGGDAALGHLDGGLDHRQGEPLDAEAIGLEITPLGLEKPVGQGLGLGIIGEQAGEALLGHPVILLVLPQRVVGVEADGRKPGRWGGHLKPVQVLRSRGA